MNQLGRLPKIHSSPSRDPSMSLVADQMVNGNFWDLGSYPKSVPILDEIISITYVTNFLDTKGLTDNN